MRNFFLALFLFTSTTVFAQVPEMQSDNFTDSSTLSANETYRDARPTAQADRPQRRPWDRPSREVAVPRGSVRQPEYRGRDRYRNDDRRWRENDRRRGWGRVFPRRRWDRPRPWGYTYVCTGPYFTWIGPVQVYIPGNCY